MWPHREPESDDEYVEMVRRGLKVTKWAVRADAAITALLAIAMVALTIFVLRSVQGWTVPDLAPGVLIGACVGIFAAFTFYSVFKSVLMIGSLFKGERTERLLVKYYDLARKTAQTPRDGEGSGAV